MKRLLEVQKEIGTLSKNAKNPFFKSQYLDLNSILTHVTPLLNNRGLVLSQELESGDVTSKILDGETGSLIAQSRLALPDISDPQKIGSCITYFRRYTLKSLLAISEEDDDGNKASKPKADSKKWLNPNTPEWTKTITWLKVEGNSIDTILKNYNISKENQDSLMQSAL